jgi:predicted Zn-dependent protease
MVRTFRLAIGLGGVLLAGACATPEYMPPAVTEAEIASVAAPENIAVRRTYRTGEEAFRLVADVEARLRPAIHQLCVEVSGRHCAFHVHVERNDAQPNAYAKADGSIAITTAMLQYLETEDEVAFVLGHEIAHHMANHLEETKESVQAGAIIGALLLGGLTAATATPYSPAWYNQYQVNNAANTGAVLGAMAGLSYSKDQEREADYLGAYVAALAGYDVGAGAKVMDKFAVISPESAKDKSFFGTHPASPEREARLLKVMAEIKAKQEAGGPLRPDKARSGSESGSGSEVCAHAGRSRAMTTC